MYIDENNYKAVDKPLLQNIDHTIFLIGDAGAPSSGIKEPVLKALQDQATELPVEKSTILFLGDNIYEYGMPDTLSSERMECQRRLDEQISVAFESNTMGIFVPGNHDWKQGKSDGLVSINNVEEYIESKNYKSIKHIPSNGCPGPEVLDLGEKTRVIILDTQWFLQDEESRPSLTCNNKTETEVLNSLEEALKNAGERKVLIAAHHPVDTHGPHGGFFTWKDHLFPLRVLNKSLWIPLPVIGSIYPLARNLGVTKQDLSSSYYQDMRDKIDAILEKYKPAAFAAGHEHSLQVLQDDGYLVLVSGAGSYTKITDLSRGSNTLFAHSHTGFMRLDFLKNGNIRLGVFIPIDDSGNSKEVFSKWINQNSKVSVYQNVKEQE